MSAMPAGCPEPTDPDQRDVPPVPARPSQRRRADLRSERKAEQRDRRWWAIGSCAVLACTFGVTVGILDVLR
jgi:hypothetical protein